MTHFIPCYKINDETNITNLFFMNIVWLYGILRNIASNHDIKFIRYF
jgi:hypothetical protein